MRRLHKETIKPITLIADTGNLDDGVHEALVIISPAEKTEKTVISSVKNQFYGTVTLDPVKTKMDFAMIVDEVVAQFTSKLGVEVKISVEIQSNSTRDGFDEAMQRSIKENCNVLKFSNAEFED